MSPNRTVLAGAAGLLLAALLAAGGFYPGLLTVIGLGFSLAGLVLWGRALQQGSRSPGGVSLLLLGLALVLMALTF